VRLKTEMMRGRVKRKRRLKRTRHGKEEKEEGRNGGRERELN